MKQFALVLTTLAALLGGCSSTQPPGTTGNTPQVRTTSDQTDADRRAQVRLDLAAAYFGRGQSETALDEVKQALVIKPDMPEAHSLRGLIYADMGEAKLADESFRRALQLNPRDGGTMHNYGWYLCQQRRYTEADPMFVQALAQPQYRDSTRTLLAQGVCQARAGQWDTAERTLMRAYELDPANPTTAVNLSEVLYHRGEYERARFYVRRVNQQPDLSSAQTLWLAARIENRLGNQGVVADLGRQLQGRFPKAPEALAFERRRFDE